MDEMIKTLDELQSAFSEAVDWIEADIECPTDPTGDHIVHEDGCGCNGLVSAAKVEHAIERFHTAMEYARQLCEGQ